MTSAFSRLLYWMFAILFLVLGAGQMVHVSLLHKTSDYHRQIQEEWEENRRVLDLQKEFDEVADLLLDANILSETRSARIAELIRSLRQKLQVMAHEHEERTVLSRDHATQESAYINITVRAMDALLLELGQEWQNTQAANAPVISRVDSIRLQMRTLQSFYSDTMAQALRRADLYLEQIQRTGWIMSLALILVLAVFLLIFLVLIHRQARLRIYQEKMSSLGLMASQLAHEIRNPLGIIKSAAAMLNKKQMSALETEEMVSYLHEEVDRIDRLVGDLLQLRREPKIEMRQQDLAKVIEKVIAFVQPEALEREVTIRYHDDTGGTLCSCDQNGIRQLVLNLLLNALSVTLSQGVIEVSTSVHGDHYRLMVRDFGPGLDRSVQARLFDPFVTTKPNGLGIGLSVVRRVVDDHHGRIDVRSSPREGTQFVILLPLKGGAHAPNG